MDGMGANNGGLFSTDRIADALVGLPVSLAQSDNRIADEERKLAQLTEALELAEVNASLEAICDGKDAATRDLQRKQAVARNADVKAAQTAALTARANVEQTKAENKQLSRQFAAYCHLAELKAAQMTLMSKGVTQ